MIIIFKAKSCYWCNHSSECLSVNVYTPGLFYRGIRLKKRRRVFVKLKSTHAKMPPEWDRGSKGSLHAAKHRCCLSKAEESFLHEGEAMMEWARYTYTVKQAKVTLWGSAVHKMWREIQKRERKWHGKGKRREGEKNGKNRQWLWDSILKINQGVCSQVVPIMSPKKPVNSAAMYFIKWLTQRRSPPVFIIWPWCCSIN